MKTIDNSILTDFSGTPLNVDGKGATITPIEVCMMALQSHRAPFEQAANVYRLGIKLASVTADALSFDLEDAEVELVRDALKSNGANFFAMILGQMAERLD